MAHRLLGFLIFVATVVVTNDRATGQSVPSSQPVPPPATMSLHEAVRTGNMGQVKAHVYWDTDVNLRDDRGVTPLMLATLGGHDRIAEVLLSAGANPNLRAANGGTALTAVIVAGRASFVELLCSHGAAVDLRGENQMSPLMITVTINDLGIARCLVDHGASASAQDPDGQSPLHLAQSSQIIELLISKGADVKSTDKLNDTPLHKAVRRDDPKCVRLLLDKGADSSAINSDGNTPFELATSEAVAKILVGSGPLQNHVRFCGLEVDATKVVYLIDASGSMVPYMRFVIDELEKSLLALSPWQRYKVVFMQDDVAVEVPSHGEYSLPTKDARGRTIQWIHSNVIPQRSTQPISAITKALALKPDVVFLLSQNIGGKGDSHLAKDELLKAIGQLNPKNASGNRATSIKCIQFVEPDVDGTMSAIAGQHGGGPDGYKLLDRRALGLVPR